MQKENIVIGMAGAGRATELHMNALKSFSGIPIRLKTIFARRDEQLLQNKTRYGFENTTKDFNKLLEDPEIDVIDICTPPYLHEKMIEQAINANKHVICEKPLTGFFGNDGEENIGKKISKVVMYHDVIKSLDKLEKLVAKSSKKFMYAEIFIYAPAIIKSKEIIEKKKSKILFIKGEESLKGSSSPVAGLWSKTGGGTFIRTGTHPLSAALWLKSQEAISRNEQISVVGVMADMGRVTNYLTEYEHRHIKAHPIDVEDSSTVIIQFSDETKAVIIANDTLLGGSRNYVELYCNDCAIDCKLTMSKLMSTYFLDEDNLDDVYISEMLPSKTGWNNPFLADEFVRGYNNQMKDFLECIYFDRNPISNFKLGSYTTKLVYAAYAASETQQSIKIENMDLLKL